MKHELDIGLHRLLGLPVENKITKHIHEQATGRQKMMRNVPQRQKGTEFVAEDRKVTQHSLVSSRDS